METAKHLIGWSLSPSSASSAKSAVNFQCPKVFAGGFLTADYADGADGKWVMADSLSFTNVANVVPSPRGRGWVRGKGALDNRKAHAFPWSGDGALRSPSPWPSPTGRGNQSSRIFLSGRHRRAANLTLVHSWKWAWPLDTVMRGSTLGPANSLTKPLIAVAVKSGGRVARHNGPVARSTILPTAFFRLRSSLLR